MITMKKLLIIICIFICVTLACKSPQTGISLSNPESTDAVIVTSEDPAVNSTLMSPAAETTKSAPISIEGQPVFYGMLNFILPSGVASGTSGSQFSRAEGEDIAPWEVTPGHIQLTLDGYLLQGKSHQPRILIYPATDYGEQFSAAFESIHRLINILANHGVQISSDQLPRVPFLHAEQAFASNIEVISFQNGQGVRFLTEYAQSPISANNQELFYQFQGLTSDGAYYVIAILPITAPVLAETSDGGAMLPPGGIVYPDITDPEADWLGYYNAVTNLLNSLPQETFSPMLNQLDALISSIQVTQ